MARAPKPKFQIFTGGDGKHHARLRAGDNKILWNTEGFERKADAEAAVFRLIGIIQSGFYSVNMEYEVVRAGFEDERE